MRQIESRVARGVCAAATLALCTLPLASAAAQGAIDLGDITAPNSKWHAVNHTASVADSGGRRILHLADVAGGSMAWNPSIDFADGEIELDVRGRDVFQKSFVGLSFHVTADNAFDVVYLRPFNFHAPDSTRHAHAIQYAGYPEAPWERLRADHPGEYETSMPASTDPDAWIHLRFALRGRDLRVYVNGASEPTLHVQTSGVRTHGGVGLYAGDLSPGDFMNLVLRPAK